MRISAAVLALSLVLLSAVALSAQAPARPGPDILGWAPLPVLEGRVALVAPAEEKLDDPDSRIRQRAVFILGQVGTKKALAACKTALDDTDRDVRIMAGVGLAQHGLSEGLPGARAALWKSPDWLKAYAIYGLYTIGTPEAERVLKIASAKGNPFISQVLKDARGGQRRYEAHEFSDEAFADVTDWTDARDAAVDGLVMESDVWFHAGEYDQAIRCNEAALFLDPHIVELYAVSGWLQWSMGRHGAAIRSYRHGIAANPASWTAYFELGFYYLHHDRPTLSLKYLKRAVDLGAPANFARTYAHALEETGQLEKSLQVWQALDERDDSGVVDLNMRRLEKVLATKTPPPISPE